MELKALNHTVIGPKYVCFWNNEPGLGFDEAQLNKIELVHHRCWWKIDRSRGGVGRERRRKKETEIREEEG